MQNYKIIEAIFIQFRNYTSKYLIEYSSLKNQPTASQVLKNYLNETNNPVYYDNVKRRYFPGTNFEPKYIHRKDAAEILRAAKLLNTPK